MADCPSEATLSRVLLDTRESETFNDVENHVEGCASCRERLERMRVNDGELTGGELPSGADLPEIRGFEMIRYLDRGGMGAVYLARQKKTGRLVALKILSSGPGAGSRERERWLREAQAFAMVRHENIVTLYDYGESNSWLYLVLEYIPGGNVQRTLDVPYSAGDAAKLVKSIAEAVSTIHAAGMLHLDLKPSNIFLDGAEGMQRELAKPRLGDFGIARRWDGDGVSLATESLGGPIGSPSHMAPEQISAKRKDLAPTADVYGLGAVLYHLLTGRAPFLTPSIVETLDQVRSVDPLSPRRLNPRIPRDLETICLKCLEKEPGRRYQTSSAVAEDLDRYLDGRPIRARPVSIATHTQRWVRRRPAVSLLAALLVFTIVAAFLGMFALWRRAEAARQLAESESAKAIFEKERSEAERLRAVANERKFIDLYGKLNGYIHNISYAPSDQKPKELLDAFNFAYGTFEQFQATKDLTEYHVNTLGLTAIQLSRSFSDRKEFPQAKSLLAKAEQLLGGYIQSHPDSYQILDNSIWAIEELANIAIQEGQIDRALDLYSRSARSAIGLKDLRRKKVHLQVFFDSAVALHDSLLKSSRTEESQRVAASIKETWQIYRDSLPHDIELMKTISRYNIILNDPAFKQMNLIAKGLDERFPIDGQLGTPEGREPVWTKSLLNALREQCAAAGLPPEIQPEICWRSHETCHKTLTKLRGEGRLEDAERGADRYLAIALEMTKSYPESHVAWWLLDEAYIQHAKNAYKRDDMADMKRRTSQALDAASEALKLEPGDLSSQQRVENRRKRMAGFNQP